MVAANENENEPVRPTALYEQKANAPGLGDMPAQFDTAELNVEADSKANQQASAAAQQTDDTAQQATETIAESHVPPSASRAGSERPAGTYDELNSFTPTAQSQQAADAAEEVGSSVGDAVMSGAAHVLDVVGDIADKAVNTLADSLADLFGGGSGPSQAKAMEAETVAPQPEATMTESEQGSFSQDEVDQRRATLLARFGRGAEATTEQSVYLEDGQSYR